MAKDTLIRFDWAVKRLLRQKTNFVVLEGFLSTLLNENIKIEKILESEGNQNRFDDKFNRVDILAENSEGELIIIEIQNNRELDYFHRMIYGTAKAITDYISLGERYSTVRKIYSVHIVYFDLGQGKDYVYRGFTEFKGIHYNDTLQLSDNQRKQFKYQDAGKLFPEYYVLRVDEFDKKAVTPLDEWILFLKTGDISRNAKAKGLAEARERLRIDDMTVSEKKKYYAHMEALRYQRSVIETNLFEGREEGLKEGLKEGKKEGLKEGLKEGKKEVAKTALSKGIDTQTIAEITGLSIEEIEKLRTAE
ncbi:MAG: Rpn family recombination-promoting nuclease/putative transposase [Tannerella sp.]|nr:Rpn family recombination-promoting nuclease/putative transposase [Tannerella sp.]